VPVAVLGGDCGRYCFVHLLAMDSALRVSYCFVWILALAID
ncbi:MAG: hypothetical protein ACI8RD_013626, partial [Bacillariaceae sp.]